MLREVGKEQFYTRHDVVLKIKNAILAPLLKKYRIGLFVDSSAGDAYLSSILDIQCKNYDISPPQQSFDVVEKRDFLCTTPSSSDIRVMVGFNPPFGIRGCIAKRFVAHAMFVWKAHLIVCILPYATISTVYDGYVLKQVYRLPENIFTHFGKPFKYPTFLCVYVKGVRPLFNKLNNTLPRDVKSLEYYRSSSYVPDSTLILVRHFGNNAGRNGFVFLWSTKTYIPYRCGSFLPTRKTLPKLTNAMFIVIKLNRNVKREAITRMIKSIDHYRTHHISFKRSVPIKDIVAALTQRRPAIPVLTL